MNRNNSVHGHTLVPSGVSFTGSVLLGFIFGTTTTVGIVLWRYVHSEERVEKLKNDAIIKKNSMMLDVVKAKNANLQKQIVELEDKIRKLSIHLAIHIQTTSQSRNHGLSSSPKA